MLGSVLVFAWSACSSDERKPESTPRNPDTGIGMASGTGSGGTPTTPNAAGAAAAPAKPSGTGAAPEPTTGQLSVSEPGNAPGTGAPPTSGTSTPSDAGSASGPAPAPPACPANPTLSAGETTQSLMLNGLNRSYLLHVPPGYTGTTPVPVVFDFHGLGGSGQQQRNLSGWAAVADREGFIMVYPNGSSNAWNVGRCCPPAADQGVDDVAFVRAMIERLKTAACIDTRRIYASGCSNGGGMSYKLACEAADVIAGIAPVDFDCVVGEQNVPSCGGCSPARPVTEIQFRATGDALVNYFGGPAPIPQGMDFPGAEQNLSDWGEINSCTGEPQAVAGNAACQAFPACAEGVQTMLCTRQGGSHCGNYTALNIANVAWEQFERSAPQP
jgi:polyhydroxybutyrate depolymerase